MAMSGGRFPYDQLGALTGPARFLIADIGTPVPADPFDVIPAVADVNGEYPAIAPWRDTGLSADSPTYTRGTDTESIEYEQTAGALFEKVSAVNRSFTAQVAGIAAENVKLIEVAPATTTVAAAAGQPAGTKVGFGIYNQLPRYRCVLVADRPAGAGVVTEPGTPARTRPPSVVLVMHNCGIAAEDADFEFSRGDPVNVGLTFTLFPESGQPAGQEHGYWWFETPGTIA
jgi:hypothetical protein